MISDGHVYLLDTLNVYKAHDKVNALEEGVDYELDVIAITDLSGEITGETNLVIILSETLEDTLVLEYTPVVTKTEGNIGNNISLNGIFENTKEKIKVTGTKVWENGPQPEIELQLFRNGVAHRDAVTLATGVTKYEWTELDKTDIDGNEYTYTIDEIAVPVNLEL